MVVRLVGVQTPGALEPDPSEISSGSLAQTGTAIDSTDDGLGLLQPDVDAHGNESTFTMVGTTDVFQDGVHDLFGNFPSVGEPPLELGDESVSAEPSLAQTSDLECEFPAADTVIEKADEPTGVSFDTLTALEVASRSLPGPSVEPIWEQGIWGVIFGDKTLLDVYKPFGETLKRPIDTSLGVAEDPMAMPSSSRPRVSVEAGLSYTDVVRDRPDISWQEQRDADLQSSVKFWMALVHRWDPRCSISMMLAQLPGTDRVFTMFAHLFAGRSPITIRKRGYSVMRLCDYLDEACEIFPCSESAFYDFLCHETTNGAPQSRLKGYMQALNFVQFVMSVSEVTALTSSARCKGACMSEYLKERIQASPLRVDELKRIHNLLQTCDDLWVKLFCGAVLMATYCRARWGDLMRAERVIEDKDRHGNLVYLEARTGRHKTMKSQMHRHSFLPMVAPTHGVDGTNWGIVWMQVRAQLGVKWPPEGLIMPAPDRQGVATSRPLETQECAAWLRKLLSASSSDPDRRLSSHSLKATMLSYAAKRGIGIPERLQLGYHTSSFQMGMVYSRDGAAASILILEKLIDEIVQGKFDPDETRSGRLVAAESCDPPAGQSEVIEVKDEPELVEDSESDQADDSSSTSSEEPRPSFVKPSPVFQPARAPEGFNLWQHKKLRTLHLMSVDNMRVFACGRMAGPLHEKLEVAPQFDTPLCSNCFNRPLTESSFQSVHFDRELVWNQVAPNRLRQCFHRFKQDDLHSK